jgi:hypothetical protein
MALRVSALYGEIGVGPVRVNIGPQQRPSVLQLINVFPALKGEASAR